MLWSVVFCLFFFFKQKTAYEMRISDWSSDVCSSDLSQTIENKRVNRLADLPKARERPDPVRYRRRSEPSDRDRRLIVSGHFVNKADDRFGVIHGERWMTGQFLTLLLAYFGIRL